MIKKSRNPLVSVIIPTFNRASLLIAALGSVLNQSYDHFEIVVADDGSTDETAARVRMTAGPIRYLPLVHSGRPSVVRNSGLTQAQGELVAFLDDDDTWEPSHLGNQVTLLEEMAAGFAYSDFQFIDNQGHLSGPALAPRQKRSGRIFNHLLQACFVHPSTLLVRRALLDRAGWFNEQLSNVEDYELCLRLAYHAPAAFGPEAGVTVRRYTRGVSQQDELQMYENINSIYKSLGRQLRLNGYQRLLLRRSRARACTHMGLLRHAKGEATVAHHCFLRSLQLNPLQCRAWREIGRSYLA